jgi:hypothetical protein
LRRRKAQQRKKKAKDTHPVSGPSKDTIRPYATPTNTGTAIGGIEVFGLVDAKIHKHKNPVPKASTTVAWKAFSTFPLRLSKLPKTKRVEGF